MPLIDPNIPPQSLTIADWVAAGVLVTLAATVWNSWVLLVEILR
jgi:hypothetical protein